MYDEEVDESRRDKEREAFEPGFKAGSKKAKLRRAAKVVGTADVGLYSDQRISEKIE